MRDRINSSTPLRQFVSCLKKDPISLVLDDEPPKLTCPKDIHAKKTNAEDTVNVLWALPIYQDNSGKSVKLFTESVRGSGFRVGRYQVEYEAADRSGNKAFCTFVIVVSGLLGTANLLTHRMIYIWKILAPIQKV